MRACWDRLEVRTQGRRPALPLHPGAAERAAKRRWSNLVEVASRPDPAHRRLCPPSRGAGMAVARSQYSEAPVTEGNTDAPLKLLHLEDDPNDAELVRSSLDTDGLACEVHLVSTRETFLEALEKERIDLIVSDFALPTFDGLSALKIKQQKAPDLPFIIVSGTLGEEAAIDSLRCGAPDYVLKHRLTRLGRAVRRALGEAWERRECKQS